MSPSPLTTALRFGKLWVAGPLVTEPVLSYWEPWQGQVKAPPVTSTVQPWWVQIRERATKLLAPVRVRATGVVPKSPTAATPPTEARAGKLERVTVRVEGVLPPEGVPPVVPVVFPVVFEDWGAVGEAFGEQLVSAPRAKAVVKTAAPPTKRRRGMGCFASGIALGFFMGSMVRRSASPVNYGPCPGKYRVFSKAPPSKILI